MGRSFAADVGHRQRHVAPLPVRISVGLRTPSPDSSGSHQDGQDHSSKETHWRCAWHHRRNVLRRLVARTMAKQMAERVEAATAPFQYALTTKAGCESVAHILQSMTDQDERATIVSIDGVGAYDLISRNAMLEGLAAVPGGDRLLPFVRHFCGSPSTYLWDGGGKTHMIPQRGWRTGLPVDALALQPRDAPRIGCGTTQTPAVRKDFRFLGRRLRGVPSGEGPDSCQRFGCGVVDARSDPGPPRQDTSVEPCGRIASRH